MTFGVNAGDEGREFSHETLDEIGTALWTVADHARRTLLGRSLDRLRTAAHRQEIRVLLRFPRDCFALNLRPLGSNPGAPIERCRPNEAA
jgi:hypothetical protein